MRPFVFILLILSVFPIFGQTVVPLPILENNSGKLPFVGKYDDLIDILGMPDTVIASHVSFRVDSSSTFSNSNKNANYRSVDVDVLCYSNSLHYYRINDSVQLSYVFFDNTENVLWYRDIRIDKRLTFRKAKKYFEIEEPSWRFDIEVPWKDKYVRARTFGIRIVPNSTSDEDMWLFFYQNTNKIWMISMPLVFEGSVIH